MLKLIKYLKGYRPQALIAPLFKFVEALFELIIPLIVARIIDVGIAGGDKDYVIKAGLVMVGLGAAGLMFSLACQYLAAVSSSGYGTNLRRNMFGHINKLSFSELDKIGASSLLTRITSDVNQTQQAVAMFIRLITRVPFIVIGSAVMAFMINAKLALVFVAGAVVISVILFLIMRYTIPSYRKVQQKLDRVNELTEENLTGARVVRAFSKQEEEERDFAAATDSLTKTSERVGRLSALLNPLTYVVINICVIAVIYFGGYKVFDGVLTQGELIALVNYLSQILLALVVFANLIVTFTKASASASRINEVFALSASVTEKTDTVVIGDDNAPEVEFDNVSFSYNADRLSLKNISFSLPRGKRLGIIGATGSGKSTLINLIPRFYDTTEGAVRYKGIDVREYPFAQLRSQVGIVAQKTGLFSGTVRENMQMGNKNIDDEKITEALKKAQAYDFVSKLDGYLDAHVEAGGKNFSGGQRQRLTIARALAKEPSLLILDDSSSALDTLTDKRLRTALEELPNLTTIIVSQRCGSIKDADAILVLEDGETVGYGTHDTLYGDCEVYREICQSQGVGKGGGK
ncbi:MAG: ABC transporter ATP-binding protein [Clostridia bacterium]|nr:ABC transporter ATP-binding protein [Clostridia bacterium]